MGPLKGLCHLLIDSNLFGYLPDLANLAIAVQSGRWDQQGIDEQIFWLKRLQSILGMRALGDSWPLDEPNYRALSDLVDSELAILEA